MQTIKMVLVDLLGDIDTENRLMIGDIVLLDLAQYAGE